MKAIQITQWCARFITEQVQPGDILRVQLAEGEITAEVKA